MSNQIYELDSILPSGRHKDKTLQWVIQNDLAYLERCFKEHKNFQISQKAEDFISKFFIIELKRDKDIKKIMQIEPLQKWDKAKTIPLPASIADGLLQQFPTLILSSQLVNAYKFVIPAGAFGEVMKLGSGQGTALLQQGSITNHGSYVSLESLATPLLFFSLASFVTGQHFMRVIQQNLQVINQQLENIRGLILNQLQSKETAIFEFVFSTQKKLISILKDNGNRVAYLNNTIQTGINLDESILFYKNQLETQLKLSTLTFESNNATEQKFQALGTEISSNLIHLQKCLETYVLNKLNEFQLMQSFEIEIENYEDIRKKIQEIIAFYDTYAPNSEIEYAFSTMIDKFHGILYDDASILAKKANFMEILDKFINISKELRERSESLKKQIQDMIELYKGQNEFIYDVKTKKVFLVTN